METARVPVYDSHWLTLSGAVLLRGRAEQSAERYCGEGTLVTCSSFFLPTSPISTLPGAEVWGFAGIFQELSVPAAELATSKMEAACAAIKSDSQNYSLSGFSPMQDGRLGLSLPHATPSMAARARRSGPRSVMPA